MCLFVILSDSIYVYFRTQLSSKNLSQAIRELFIYIYFFLLMSKNAVYLRQRMRDGMEMQMTRRFRSVTRIA